VRSSSPKYSSHPLASPRDAGKSHPDITIVVCSDSLLSVSLNSLLRKTLIAQFGNYPSSLYLVDLFSSEKYDLYILIQDYG